MDSMMIRRWIAAIFMAAILLPASPAQAQESGTAPPEWVLRYFQSEVHGPKFGHAWTGRAETLRRARARTQAQLPGPPPGKYDLSGTFKVAVLAGTYSDVDPRYAPEEYEQAFFGETGSNGHYTLNQFYREASGDEFGFAGTVTPWIRLDHSHAYYVDNFSNGGRGRFEEYIYDVLIRADTIVDWRQYDNDGPDGVPDSGDDDGYVDMVIFLHPLADGVCRDGELAGPVGTGYRLEYLSRFGNEPFTTSVTGANGQALKVDDFVLSAGLSCDGSSIPTMNINIHEMGHALGLPDMYDLDGSSWGVGIWDVMGYGIYARDGRPTMFGAWSRRQLGWASVARVTTDATLVLEPTISSRQIYRIDIPGANEYFLLENRQRLLSDAGLPGTGLVLWHVNNDVLFPLDYRVADHEERPAVAVVQADGRDDLGDKGSVGDAGDPFPGSTNVTTITKSTVPSTRGSSGADSGIRVMEIREEGMEISLAIRFDAFFVVAAQDLPPARLGQMNYSTKLRASGGVGTLTWTATDPLPSWLKLEPGGTLHGTPEEIGFTSFDVTVTDESGQRAEAEAVIEVVIPSLNEPAIFDELLATGSLNDVQRRALDLIGNENGRLDIGDIVRFRAIGF